MTVGDKFYYHGIEGRVIAIYNSVLQLELSSEEEHISGFCTQSRLLDNPDVILREMVDG